MLSKPFSWKNGNAGVGKSRKLRAKLYARDVDELTDSVLLFIKIKRRHKVEGAAQITQINKYIRHH